MSDTLKRAGASCPKCHEPYCAEYAQKGQKGRWSCSCGAGGDLIGAVSGSSVPAPAAAPAKQTPQWVARNLTKG
jgi:hypothetical protein